MKRAGVVGILALAFFGLADSAYLMQSEINGVPLICNIQSLSGCNIVATSHYSNIFGVPLPEFGVLFYGILFILTALELVLFNQLLRRILQIAALVGVAASLYFIFVQIFLIGAFCIYCTASALTAFLILVLAGYIEPLRRSRLTPPAPPGPEFPKGILDMPPTV